MYDKTVSYLAKAVSLLPPNNPASAIIKSHYITKCRIVQFKQQTFLNKKCFGPNTLCTKCGNPWLDVEKVRIQSPKRKFKHKDRILQKEAKPGTKLKSLQDKIIKKHTTKLLRICKYCRNCSAVNLELNSSKLLKTPNKIVQTSTKIKGKPNQNIRKANITKNSKKNNSKLVKNKVKTPELKSPSKVKKKKSKDKLAGLNPNAVRQAIGSNQNQTKSKNDPKYIKKLAKILKTNEKQDMKSLLNLLK